MASNESRGLILASISPRRQDLLRAAGVEFTVAEAVVDESTVACEKPREAVTRLAAAKARDVSRRCPGSWVLAADTLVALHGEALGKPEGEEEAGRMIARLSGREHEVLTGVVLLGPDGQIRHHEAVSTMVLFRRVSQREIRAYVCGGEPLDKAGAYGIQGWGGHFVASISGSYTNVVGLPLEMVLEVLASFGLYSYDA